MRLCDRAAHEESHESGTGNEIPRYWHACSYEAIAWEPIRLAMRLARGWQRRVARHWTGRLIVTIYSVIVYQSLAPGKMRLMQRAFNAGDYGSEGEGNEKSDPAVFFVVSSATPFGVDLANSQFDRLPASVGSTDWAIKFCEVARHFRARRRAMSRGWKSRGDKQWLVVVAPNKKSRHPCPSATDALTVKERLFVRVGDDAGRGRLLVDIRSRLDCRILVQVLANRGMVASWCGGWG